MNKPLTSGAGGESQEAMKRENRAEIAAVARKHTQKQGKVAAHLPHPIVVRRFWSDHLSFASQVSTSRVATQYKFSAFAIGFSWWIGVLRPYTSTPATNQLVTDRVPPYRRYCCTYSYQRVSHRSHSAFVFCSARLRLLFLLTAKLALPRLSSATQRYHSPMPTGDESYFTVPSRSSVHLLPAGVFAGVEWLRAIFAAFLAPVPASRCPREPWLHTGIVFSCGRATAPPVVRSLFTSHGTSVKPTPALRPVFLRPVFHAVFCPSPRLLMGGR